MERTDIRIIENYVDSSFEEEVLKLVPKLPQITKDRNQILRWGNSVPYKDNIISEEIPKIFDRFRDDIVFDSVTINEYYPNQTIDWHIDRPAWLKSVHIISLLSDANLKFRKGTSNISYHIPRYSLTEFWGDLRYYWQHSLTAKEKRYSIVFRDSKKE